MSWDKVQVLDNSAGMQILMDDLMWVQNLSINQSVNQSVKKASPVLNSRYSNLRCADWMNEMDHRAEMSVRR